MVLSPRDREILLHIESWGFATIKQITDIFFREQKYGYDMARKRLNLMVKDHKLFVHRNYENNMNIYTFEKIKKVSQSNIIVMDFYAKLMIEGAEILLFEREYNKFMDGKIRPDIFVAVKIENWIIYMFVEAQLRHVKADIEKYEKLYASGDFQRKFSTTTFPTVVVIDDVKHKKDYESPNFKIAQIDLCMGGFPKIYMPQC